jgi:Ca2+-transporting ATPase
MLYGISVLMVLLPLNLDFLKKFLGLTNLTTNQVLICLGLAFVLLLVDEVIKFFMRRSRRKPEGEIKTAAVAVSS